MRSNSGVDRRTLLATSLTTAAGAALPPGALEAARHLRVSKLELLPIRATARTVWLIVRLGTDAGLTGLGEASDAFGFANTTKEDAARMGSELRAFFALIESKSPLEIATYRQQAERLASGRGLLPATAYSAIEQALWDLAARALDVPTYALFGGKLRDTLPVYANINRATRPRTPEGFAAAAKAAVQDGFRAVKAAPFDGFPPPSAPAANRAVDVIMPDVKHCGGLLELMRIAAMAEADGVAVAPHNPSGPVATAASVQVCAVLKNFRLLEFQWGEVDWRREVIEPYETFERGTIRVPDRPGFGIELNERVVRAHGL